MPSSYTTSLRLTLPATGELAGTWGSTVNTGITELLDAAVAGTATISTWGGAGVAYTLSNNSGTADEARRMFIVATGTPGEAKNVICPAVSKFYVFRNDTTGGFALTLKTPSGTGIAVPAGQYKFLYCDGTNVVETFNSAGALTLSGALSVGGTATFAANPTLSAGTANGVLYLNGSKVATSGSALVFDGTSLLVGKNTSDANNWGIQNYATNAFGSGLQLTYGGVGSAGLWVPAASTLAFGADAGSGTTELMRLTSTGLGIGTSSPNTKLEIANAATGIPILRLSGFNSADNTQYGVIQFYNEDASQQGPNIAASIKAITAANADGSGGQLTFATSTGTGSEGSEAVERMRIDGPGNLGLGTTPSAWDSARKAIQLGGTVSYFAANSVAVMSANMYFGGPNTYIGTGYATQYSQSAGEHIWNTAPSGTAGNVISFSQVMTLNASGRLGIGTTSPLATLEVNGYTNTSYPVLVAFTGAKGSFVGIPTNQLAIVDSTAQAAGVGGEISFEGKYDASAITSFAAVGGVKENSTSSDYGGAFVVRTRPNGGNLTERARITSSGNVVAGGSVALATTATDGFLYVPTCAGTPTGVPTAITGMAPIVVNTTNNKLYFYSGGTWRDAGP